MKVKILALTLVLFLLMSPLAFAGSVFCNDLYWLDQGDILDILTDDFEISFWMRQDGDPTSTSTVAGKGSGTCAAGTYYVTVTSTGALNTCVRDGNTGNPTGQFNFDITAFLDDAWHHYYVFVDRSDVTTCEIWVDGVEKTLTSTSGTIPTLDQNFGNFFTVGAGEANGNPQEGYLADLKVKIGGTKNSQAQIEFQAANPWDYSSSAWTADGTREAWRLDDGSGTNAAAELTTPGNDLTATNALIWNADGPAVAAGGGAQVIIITN